MISTEWTENSYVIDGYKIFTNFGKCESRGVSLYVKDDIKARQLDYNVPSVESVFVEISINKNDKILCGVVYRSPSLDNHESLITLMKLVASSDSYTRILIFGDFNYPEIDWENHLTNTDITHPAYAFLEAIDDCLLTQHIDKATRHRQGQRSNCLDLIFTNDSCSVQKLHYKEPLGSSDHLSIEMEYTVNVIRQHNLASDSKRYAYDRGDYKSLKNELKSVNWDKEFKDMTPNSMMSYLESKLNSAMDKFIPVYSTSKNLNKKQPLWMNRSILKSLKKKHNAYKRWITTRNGKDYERYRKHSNTIKSKVRSKIKEFEKNIATAIKTNSKKYWQYANSKLKTKSQVPDLKINETNYTTSEQEKVDILNDFFTSVFTKEDLSNLPNAPNLNHTAVLTDVEITEEAILEVIKSLDTSKSPGPDNIHPRVLKETADVIAYPLHLIFKGSLNAGLLPDTWKIANVSPIFKKGNKHVRENYRPISLTSIVCRVMERIIKNAVVKHLEEHSLFSPDQFGFRSKRSCVLQLLHFFEDVTSMLDEGKYVDVIYFDFAKAFDSVPHQRLLVKIKSYGIDGKVLNWISSFLSNRQQRVVLNGYKSAWTNVLSGVPQGSVLGPLLFVLYINDLPKCLNKCKVKMFADDLKLYSSNDGNKIEIQSDVSNIGKWSKQWQLPLNANKCHVLYLGNQTDTSTRYHLHDEKKNCEADISIAVDVTDLGVVVDDKLKFDKQVAERVKKANGILASIKRTIKFINKEVFLTLYKSLVRPLLETAGAIWSPNLIKQVKMLENVQRRATKLVQTIKDESYGNRLRALDLPSLEYRRKRGDMILTFKLLNGFMDTDPSLLFELNQNKTRGHKLKLFKKRCNLGIRKAFFTQRIVNDWNNLTTEVVNCSTVQQFERAYDKLKYADKFTYT